MTSYVRTHVAAARARMVLLRLSCHLRSVQLAAIHANAAGRCSTSKRSLVSDSYLVATKVVTGSADPVRCTTSS
jgi:hypothetical protein